MFDKMINNKFINKRGFLTVNLSYVTGHTFGD